MEDLHNEQAQEPEQPKKNVIPENKRHKHVKKEKKVDPKYQEEQKKLFEEADKISPVSKKIDRDEIHFIGGTVKTWQELLDAHSKFKKYISDKVRDWELTFPEEIYRQWRKLNGWDMDSKSRPMIFAYYTVRDIYGSLPREIYSTLDELNEYIYPGASIRVYKYCQLLTKGCHKEVRKIIEAAIEFATSSKDLYEYRLKLAARYGQPFSKTVFQMDMFRDNDDILG
jgi:hypothetical protein